jgi:Zn-dependent protease
MLKKGSLRLFSVRGIDIRLHYTFPLILIWAALQFGVFIDGGLSGAVFGVVAISLLFVLVTLHELGHSFAAMHYGIAVEQIILSPIGGMAQLRRMPEEPRQELVVALAGPAVNFVMALIMGALALGLGFTIGNPFTGLGTFSLLALFSYVFIYNIFLGVFNLLPAFPMDGGRVLQALLAMRLDYVRATKIAATVGRGIALLMGLYGLMTGSFFMMLIAVFIYTMAGQEAATVEVTHTLRGSTVQQAYNDSVHRLHPHYPAQQAVNIMMFSGESTLPVTQDGLLVGLVTRAQLLEILQTGGQDILVGEIMKRDITPVSLQSEITAVQQRLNEEGLDALPVVGHGQFLIGLITRRHIADLYRLLSIASRSRPRVQSA